MGLRKPPGKQPSQLPSKVPGEELAEAKEQALAEKPGQINLPEPVREHMQSTPSVTDSLVEQPVQQSPEEDPQQMSDDPDTLLRDLAKSEAFLETVEEADQELTAGPELVQEGTPEAEQRPLGFRQEMAARAIQNLGRNPAEQKSLLQKALGKDFEVKSRGDELFFRKRGSKKFFPIDREGMFTSLREFIADALPDISGELLETGVAVGTEVGAVKSGAVAGGTLGLAAGGPAGGFAGAALGSGAGFVAGIPASAAASVAAREGAIRYFEGETSTDLKDEFVLNTGINAATLGTGMVLKRGVKRGLAALQEILESQPKVRVQELAEIRQSFEQVRSDVGLPEVSPAKGGQQIYDSVVALNNRLDKKVGLVKEQAIAAAGERRFPTERYAQKLSQILESVGITKEQQQFLAFSREGIDVEKLPDEIKNVLNNRALAKRQLLGKLREAKVFGSDTGADFVDEALTQLGKVNQSGGLKAKEMFDLLDYWKQPAGYKPGGVKVEFPAETQALARQLRMELTGDRSALFADVFKGNPEQLAYAQAAFKEYAERIDYINKFKQVFKRQTSAEKFTRALIAPKNSQQIKNLKFLLGSDSDEFNFVKAQWFSDVTEKAIDPVTGTVKPVQLEKSLKAYGDDVLGEMIEPKQLESLKFVANRAKQIPNLDMSQNASQTFVKDAASVLLLNYKHPAIVVRALWFLSRGNADAAHYLANDGLLDVATSLKDPIKRTRAVKVIESFQRLLDATDVATDKAGRKYLKPMDIEQRLQDPQVQELLMKQLPKPGQMDNLSRGKAPGAGGVALGTGAIKPGVSRVQADIEQTDEE